MKKLTTFGALIAGLLLAVNVHAANFRVGVLDMHEVMQKSPQVKELRESLQKKFKSREDGLVAERDKFQKEAEKLEKEKTVLSKGDLEKLEKKVLASQRDLQKKQMDFQQDVMKAQNEALKTFIDNVKDIVKGVAKDEKIEIVLTKDTIAYVDDSLDITSKVLKKLDKK